MSSRDSPYDLGWAVRGGLLGLFAMVLVVVSVWWVTAGKTWMRERTLNARTREFLDCVSQPGAEAQAACLLNRHGWAQQDAFTVVMHWHDRGRTQPPAELLKRDLNRH